MSKSDDNTSELESYGVWVKNPSEKSADGDSIDSLDLPDFDDANFSDMFSEDLTEPAVEENIPAVEEENTANPIDDIIDDSEPAGEDTVIEENAFDIFEDSPAEDIPDVFAESDDTTLSTDELMNIANTAEIEETETDFAAESIPSKSVFDDSAETELSSDDFSTESVPEDESISEALETESGNQAEEIFAEPSEPAAEESTEDDSLSEAGIEEFNSTLGNHISEVTIEAEDTANNEFEEISFDDIDEPAVEKEAKKESSLAPGEEEISIDDFLEDGFSDESVAAGNNGYEPGMNPEENTAVQAASVSAPAPAAGGDSEEISLDDFGVSFDDAASDSEVSFDVPSSKDEFASPAADTTEDEPLLDMDISFDDSTETLETEDNAVDSDYSDFTADDTEDYSEETNEVESKEEEYVADTSNVSTEEVDLSDFGIDTEDEENHIKQNMEEKKATESVVDYDLAIGDEDSSLAPVVSEIVQPSAEQSAEEMEDTHNEAADSEPVQAQPQADSISTQLLQQIVADLSGLKDEINRLKSNIAEIKENEGKRSVQPAVEEPVTETDDKIEEQPAVSEEITEDFSDISNEETSSDEGFFSSEDGDDTIALSAEELSNINIDAEPVEGESIPTESIPTESISSESAEEPVVVEEAEPSIEETAVSFDEVTEETSNEDGGFFADTNEDNTIALSGDELSNIMNTSEVIETAAEDNFAEPEVSEEIAEETGSDEPVSDETSPFENEVAEETEESDLTFNFEEKLEEPDMENINLDEEQADLPDEISIPKEDENIFVESTSSDFMESVHDLTEPEESEIEDISGVHAEAADEIELPETIDEAAIFNESTAMESTSAESNLQESSLDETASQEPIFDESTVENEEDFIKVEDELPEISIETQETEEFVSEEVVAEETVFEEPASMEESVEAESVSEETVAEETVDSEPVFEETSVSEPLSEENEISIEPVTEPVFEETAVNEPLSEENELLSVDELSKEIENVEKIDISAPAAQISETVNTEAADEDISFPSVDSFEELSLEPDTTDSAIESPAAVEESTVASSTVDTTIKTDDSLAFDSVDSLFDSDVDESETAAPALSVEPDVVENPEEPIIEETVSEETISDEIASPEAASPEVSETEIPDFDSTDTIESDFAEVDNLDNELSSGNMDYLKAELEPAASNAAEAPKVNDDLKQDIKSVLLYMDQLLENLPEEKIMEFAKSNEFVTYKKLFSELGLS